MEDIILEEQIPEDVTHLTIISNQLSLIATIQDMPDDIYDQLMEHKIRAINNAMIIIHNCQYQIFNQLNEQ
jgi:hypothetical protein